MLIAWPSQTPPLQTRVDAIAKQLHPGAIAVRRDLHRYPELGFRETASSDRFVATIIGKSTHGAMPHTGIDPVPIAAVR